MSVFLRSLVILILSTLLLSPAMSTFQVGQIVLRPEPGIVRTIYPAGVDNLHEDFDVNIIVVPEIGAASGRTFSELSWMSELKHRHSINPLVATFDYDIATDGVPIWQSLAEHGVALPYRLLNMKEEIGLFKRPLILVGHGLGGIIVKKALTFLHGEQYNSHLRHILEVHSATIFLGTPHPTYARQDGWPMLQHLLRSLAKFSKRSLLQAEQEAAIVANISLKFEDAGIKPLLISAYETKTTKISGGIFGNRYVLVDKRLAETQRRSETLVAVSKSHRSISTVDASAELYREVVALLRTVLRNPFVPNITVNEINVDTLAIDDYAWTSTVDDADLPKTGKPPSKESKDNTKDGVQGTTESSFEIIPNMSDFLQERPAPKLPCHMLGPEEPIPEFTGRQEEIKEIEGYLSQPTLSPTSKKAFGNVPRSFALCGSPGIGKSRLATEYMHKHKKDFDAVFWVQADSNNSLADDYLKIAREMELLHPSESKDAVIARNVLMEWFANPWKQAPAEELQDSVIPAPRADWLLIFDNADDLDILGDYWPETGPGAILITSRNPMAKRHSTNKAGHDLQPLAENAGATLLRKLAKAEDTNQNVSESISLADRLDNLPLAISQVAAVIKRKDLKFSEFLEILNEEASQKELLLDEGGYSHTLSTIWRIDKLPPGAKSLLDVLSLLDRSNIVDALFEAHLPADTLYAFPTTKLQYYNARDSLVQSSLVGRNKSKEQILIHQLLQTITRARMSPQELQNAFSAAVNILVGNWPQASYAFSHEKLLWERAQQLVPHVIRIAGEYEKNPEWSISYDTQRDLAELLQNGGWHVTETGNFNVAERMWNMSLRICERNAEAMTEEYADALFCYGSYMTDTNQFKSHKAIALKHFEQRMKLENRKSSLGLGAGMAYSEMSLAHLLNDEYNEAIEYAAKSREINEKTSMFLNNEYWPFFAFIHHAQALIGLQRYAEAAVMVEQTIQWREVKYGIDDTQEFKLGYALQVLAQIRLRQGRHEESGRLYQRSYANYLETVGPNHHRTGHVLVQIAEHEARLGHVELADTLYDNAITIFKSHGYYEPEMARTTFKKGQLHQSQGDHDTALRLFSETQLRFRKVSGSPIDPNHELCIEDFDRIVAIWAR